ncbi:hypothetical protein VOLCADRAFT_95560 [Volvox carteri f. nagariensis]|uniref:Glycerol-3-phosphate dehydrogenase [NAD(+)] n=1 Tax=Volvox carteri f. nagariensis TaxID=3068 RepID=D8U7Y0_VOLCA|nr:uncharacterized protein VOLCADRAFT_95560 [Volvox carteri f. nagariensis]EFJ44172.1 hypothetical protein VOLCADRAFT_95560 [Volvox carteri f. nagariensis]|eukprot:XP_002954766.1 hypothetical protein VOLCADRAFT_95560 [Volvox carteri f. nagariensis]
MLKVGHNTELCKVGVLGGGSWGTALAIHCARLGHDTVLWARGAATVDSINLRHENPQYLPGFPCPPALTASCDLEGVIKRSELMLMVVPTQYIVATLGEAARALRPHQILVSCSKGISLSSLETVDELLQGVVPYEFRSRLAYLSGPSFAAEVATGQPTAVTVAAKARKRGGGERGPDDQLAARVQSLLSSPRFRCYRSTDVVGVEMAGALKNVLAIACGISDGLGFGNNARAALITRGLYEITKLAVARGGNPLTMSGLAGMGDVVLTCTGDLSRNRTVGLRLGRGERLRDIQASMGGAVAEGVPTAVAIRTLARKLGVECPIMEGIHRVIHEGANAQEVVTEVMSRELKPEVAPDIIRGVLTNNGGTNSNHHNHLLECPARSDPAFPGISGHPNPATLANFSVDRSGSAPTTGIQRNLPDQRRLNSIPGQLASQVYPRSPPSID